MNDLLDILKGSAKAIVAAVVPIVTVTILDATTELGTLAQGAVASVATAVLVWLKRNTPTPT
jgi:hypothetical protein